MLSLYCRVPTNWKHLDISTESLRTPSDDVHMYAQSIKFNSKNLQNKVFHTAILKLLKVLYKMPFSKLRNITLLLHGESDATKRL